MLKIITDIIFWLTWVFVEYVKFLYFIQNSYFYHFRKKIVIFSMRKVKVEEELEEL